MIKNNKSLGQHWLKNRAILDEIADLASGAQSCLEIGPGLGTLTSSLLKRFDKVIAVEFDKNLADNLPKSFPGKNLTVVNQDILEIQHIAEFLSHFGGCYRELGPETREDGLEGPGDKNLRYVVVGNIPYYITSPIIKKFLTIEPLPVKIVLLIQKEVAERIADDRETVLSLFVKNYAKVELGPVVKREEFTPPPKVDSQVIILTPYPQPQIAPQIFKLIKLGFTNPRKKLLANLSALTSHDSLKQIFAQLGISENARPADLHLDKWSELSDALKS